MTDYDFECLDSLEDDMVNAVSDPDACRRATAFLRSLGRTDEQIAEDLMQAALEGRACDRCGEPDPGDPFFENPTDRDILLSVVGSDIVAGLEATKGDGAAVLASVDERYGADVVAELGFGLLDLGIGRRAAVVFPEDWFLLGE